MIGKINWKLLSSTVGFTMIGLSIFIPQQKWLIIVGALLFAVGMLKTRKKKK